MNSQDQPRDPKKSPKQRIRKTKMTLVSMYIHESLLEKVDKAAQQEFTNRSDIIRTALVWYLRASSQDQDPEATYKLMKQRHTKAALKKLLEESKD